MRRIVILFILGFVLLSFFSCNDFASSDTNVTEGDVEITDPPLPRLMISGIDISEFTIVYKKDCTFGEDLLASDIAKHIKERFGVQIPVCDDSVPSTPHEIIIGNNKHVNSSLRAPAVLLDNYKLDFTNSMLFTGSGHLWIICNSAYNTEPAVNRFISDITPQQSDVSINIDYSKGINVVADSLGGMLKIMSYNVQTGNSSSVLPRVKNVIRNITDFGADVVGTQEINYIWLDEMEKAGFLDIYTRVGEARQGDEKKAGNEYSCIFFKTDKFKLIDSGTYWLSDTPNEISKLPDCDYYRIMTYALLECIADGTRYLHVNAHLEWDHGEVKTNLLQTNIMLDLTDEILSQYGDVPVIFTGDYNVFPSSLGYERMLSWGNVDSRAIAHKSTDANTFSGEKILDFCFVSDGDFEVSEFSVGTTKSGSDHYPVFVELYFLKK